MKKYKIGFLCGFFDPLHAGHIDIIRKAKEMCEYLIVAVGTDEFMIRRKQRNSALPFDQRCEIIRSIRYVDQVVPEKDLDKITAYKTYHFDVMFAGDDHSEEQLYIQAARVLNKMGTDTIFIPRERNISSSDIREKISRSGRACAEEVLYE